MQALLAPLLELADFSGMREGLRKKKFLSVSGCADSQKLHMMFGLSGGFKYKIIVTYSDLRVREILEDYQLYDRNVMSYPAKERRENTRSSIPQPAKTSISLSFEPISPTKICFISIGSKRQSIHLYLPATSTRLC